DAKQQGGSIATGPVTAGGDRLVTQVVTLKYESAAQLINVLRPLITPNNTIAAFPNGNALVITDYADNLKRLDRIISSLDQPPGGEPVMVPLRYASAIDIVPLITKLVADTFAAGAAAPSVGNARQPAGGGRGAGGAGCRSGAVHVFQYIDLRRGRCDDHGRHREQRARDHGARARLQQSARDHREARHAPRASLRRS